MISTLCGRLLLTLLGRLVGAVAPRVVDWITAEDLRVDGGAGGVVSRRVVGIDAEFLRVVVGCCAGGVVSRWVVGIDAEFLRVVVGCGAGGVVWALLAVCAILVVVLRVVVDAGGALFPLRVVVNLVG